MCAWLINVWLYRSRYNYKFGINHERGWQNIAVQYVITECCVNASVVAGLPCVYWTYSIFTLNQWFNFCVVINAHVSHGHPVDTDGQSQVVSHYWISLPNEKMVQFYIHDMAGLGLLFWRIEGVMRLEDTVLFCCTMNRGGFACGLNTLCHTSCGQLQGASSNSKQCGGYPKLA